MIEVEHLGGRELGKSSTFASKRGCESHTHEQAEAQSKPRWAISPDGRAHWLWNWFVLIVVLYVVFSVPYVLAFLSNTSQCGAKERLWPLRNRLSQMCQGNEDFAAFAASSQAATGGLTAKQLQYAMMLPCASGAFSVLNILADAIFAVDIVLAFMTGYIPPRTSEPRYDWKGIVRAYLRGTFVMDAVASCPWNWIFRTVMSTGHSAWLVVELMRLTRLARLWTFVQKTNKFNHDPWIRLAKLLGLYLLCAHMLACLFFFVGRWQLMNLEIGGHNEFTGDPWLISECLQFADDTTQYNVSLYWAFTTLTTVGYGDIVPITNMDKSFVMAVMLSSGTLQAFILANVAMAVGSFGVATARTNDRLKKVFQALNFYDVPVDLQQRVLDSVEYYWAQHNGVEDDDVLQLVPSRIRDDVAVAIKGDFLWQIEIFQGCSKQMHRALSACWTLQICPPDEVLVESGDYRLQMFYLHEGVCQVRSEAGLEYAQVQSGSAFGDLETVLGLCHGAQVRALTYCTVYCISRAQLLEVLEVFPEDAGNIVRIARAKQELLRESHLQAILTASGPASNSPLHALAAPLGAPQSLGNQKILDIDDDRYLKHAESATGSGDPVSTPPSKSRTVVASNAMSRHHTVHNVRWRTLQDNVVQKVSPAWSDVLKRTTPGVWSSDSDEHGAQKVPSAMLDSLNKLMQSLLSNHSQVVEAVSQLGRELHGMNAAVDNDSSI